MKIYKTELHDTFGDTHTLTYHSTREKAVSSMSDALQEELTNSYVDLLDVVYDVSESRIIASWSESTKVMNEYSVMVTCEEIELED